MADHRGRRKESPSTKLDLYRRHTSVIAESTRRAQFLSREKAAEKLGVSARTVRSWEDGDRRLEVAELIVMAEAYGMDPAAMFAEILKGRKRGEGTSVS